MEKSILLFPLLSLKKDSHSTDYRGINLLFPQQSKEEVLRPPPRRVAGVVTDSKPS